MLDPQRTSFSSVSKLPTRSSTSPVKTRNAFAVLQEEEELHSISTGPVAPTLADFVITHKTPQGQARKLKNADLATAKVPQPMSTKVQQSMSTPVPKVHTSLSRPTCNRSLCALTTVEPSSLSSLDASGSWEMIDFAVDSGASETVVPSTICTSVSTVPSEASRRGVMYEVANGEMLPNLGEKQLHAFTEDDAIPRRIKAQVCEVNKPLLSVSRLVSAGNTVVFSPDGAFAVRQVTIRSGSESRGGCTWHVSGYRPTPLSQRQVFSGRATSFRAHCTAAHKSMH